MNDWLDYKGSGSSRAYAANDFIAHSSRSEKTEALMKQRDAYDRLSKALVEKANKLLDELESADKSVADISATIRDNTRKDKNYNANGLLQRKKTYLIRRATINAELDKTIKDYSGNTLEDYNKNPVINYGNVIYLVDYQQNNVVDYNNNNIYIKEDVI